MLRPFYLSKGDGSRRFCLLHGNVPEARACLLYIHPFAEEMNKTRRMVALQSRAFAEMNLAVLQIDLLGCGDSDGDFGDATWDDWIGDLDAAKAYWHSLSGAPLLLWALRAGCLLASECEKRWGDVPAQLWWQPPSSGRQVFTHWLRMRQTADKIAGRVSRAHDLRADLLAKRPIDIAGYACSPELLLPLEVAELHEPRDKLAWFEVSSEPAAHVLPASEALLAGWAQKPEAACTIGGPKFWQTTEIEEAAALIQASCDWVAGVGS